MSSRQKIFIPFTLFVLTISLGVIIPGLILESNIRRVVYNTPRPPATSTPTPFQPIKASYPLSTNTAAPIASLLCTYNTTYWLSHPEAWPPVAVIGSASYTREDMLQLLLNATNDTTIMLIRTFYITALNLHYGADPLEIASTVAEANTWLTENIPGSELTQDKRDKASSLAARLNDYNNGVVGPGLCPDAPPAPTALPTDTPTAAPTDTPTAVPTDTPDPTPVPTQRPVVLPTKTPVPTRIPDPPTPAPPTAEPSLPPPSR
ncbi:MAG: hypothetical protein EHM70_00415 [Chloroflexota bacterium]|nr:MAG: hypothetical protein EHM70_00415 [Chloroflexota bacterium]